MTEFRGVQYIFRGVSGSGKTTAAEETVGKENVASADAFFYKKGKERTGLDGVYDFNPKTLWIAHKLCRKKIAKWMVDGIPKIAVANTSTTNKDVEDYIKIAKEHNYKTIVLTVENRHGGVNLHEVPEEALERQAKQLRKSIKLRADETFVETYTLDEIRNYIMAQESRGDILYNLKDSKIKKANN